MWPLIIFGILILSKFLIYYDKGNKIKKYFKLYLIYLDDPNYEFSQNKQQIIQLFKDANLNDFNIQRIEPIGYGKLKNISASGFENISVIDSEVVIQMNRKFNEAIGVFRHRMIEAINPLFWIEFIFKLPQFILEFVGVLPEKILVKIILILYWIALLFLGLKKFNLLERLIN